MCSCYVSTEGRLPSTSISVSPSAQKQKKALGEMIGLIEKDESLRKFLELVKKRNVVLHHLKKYRNEDTKLVRTFVANVLDEYLN